MPTDTDPSTPEALRGLAPTDPTPNPTPLSARVSTEPGMGPPSQPAIALNKTLPMNRTPPMGIVVPSTPVHPRKDSVELLLDGMQGPQPERPKVMPQTDGQASAAYHAEHTVRPARTSPDSEPKVVVERPPMASTTRIDRTKVQAVIEQAEARRRAMEAESTAVVPQQIAPRVFVAVVAGLMVVLGVFLALRLVGARTPVASNPPAAPTPTLAAPPAIAPALPLPATPVTPTPTPAIATATATADTAAVAPAAPPATTAAPASTKPKATPRPAPTGSGDLGEFKTTFH